MFEEGSSRCRFAFGFKLARLVESKIDMTSCSNRHSFSRRVAEPSAAWADPIRSQLMAIRIRVGVTRGATPLRRPALTRVKCTKGFGLGDADEAADALTRSLSSRTFNVAKSNFSERAVLELSKKEGRVSKGNNLVIGGNTSEDAWRQLDEKVSGTEVEWEVRG